MMDERNNANTHKRNAESSTDDVKASRRFLEHWHIVSIWLIAYDILAANIAYFLGLWLRFDCHFSKIPLDYLQAFLDFAPYSPQPKLQFSLLYPKKYFLSIYFYFLNKYKTIQKRCPHANSPFTR